VGDVIYHKHRRAWGIGKVVEVKTSILDGGPALVRILFQDGRDRTFFNDLEDTMCCYYAGVRFYDHR
jgi:hypothetical protein